MIRLGDVARPYPVLPSRGAVAALREMVVGSRSRR